MWKAAVENVTGPKKAGHLDYAMSKLWIEMCYGSEVSIDAMAVPLEMFVSTVRNVCE